MRNTRSEDAWKIPPDEQSKGSDLMGPSHRTQALVCCFQTATGTRYLIKIRLGSRFLQNHGKCCQWMDLLVDWRTLQVDRKYLAPAADEMNRYANYVYDEFSPDRDAEGLYVEVV